MRFSSSLSVLLAFAFLISHHSNARANWTPDGIPISVTQGDAYGPVCVTDGAGGAIMCWTELRTGSYDVFAQRVSGAGNVLWTPNGVIVGGATGDQVNPTLIADGAGGAIIAWQDTRAVSPDVYVQRINSSGATLWTVNGVAMCTAADIQSLIGLVSDGAGGAIVSWQDLRSGSHYDVYARRIIASGTPQWTANGVAICTAAGNQVRPQPVPDGAGGAIIAWSDSRTGVFDIYAQRINSAGTVQWTANGLTVCTASGSQSNPDAVSDGAGGSIIAWGDGRNAVDLDVYAQRINGSGVPQWGADGEPLSALGGEQANLAMTSDGAGGAFVVWQDTRVSALEVDLYGQRINALGAPVWLLNGLPICDVVGTQNPAALAPDGQGGVVVAWSDDRTPGDADVFAQLISGDGFARWQLDGAYVCAALGNQGDPSCAVGGNGAIVAWADGRSANHIYAQRVEMRYGYWGHPEPAIVSASDNPGDQGGFVNLRWNASQLDLFFLPGISHYSIWRTTDFVAARAPATSARIVASPAEIGKDFEGTAFWEETTPSGPVFWEWIGNLPAVFQDSYSYLTPTRFEGAMPPHYFKVISHETPYPQTRAWESAFVTGFSLDNLAPPAPLELTGASTPWDVTLTWESGGTIPDFSHYVIYRGSGFVLPLPQYRIGIDTETHHVDDSVPNGYLRYIVTAMDTHGNESLPSNEWSPGGLTPVETTPSITKLTVLGNSPNPFSHRTTLRIGLPKASDVQVELFDVAGRRVRLERTPSLAAGWREVSLDAGDPQVLASGVYFCRVTAAGQAVTRKMIIAR